MEGTITLYHGTRSPIADRVTAEEDIIKNIDPSSRDSFQGSLTDSEWVAWRFALFPPSRQIRSLLGPAVIEYQIPRDLVVDHGVIPGYSAHGFSTREIVSPEEVPEEYLANIGLTREKAIEEVRHGTLSFYRISSRYITRISEY